MTSVWSGFGPHLIFYLFSATRKARTWYCFPSAWNILLDSLTTSSCLPFSSKIKYPHLRGPVSANQPEVSHCISQAKWGCAVAASNPDISDGSSVPPATMLPSSSTSSPLLFPPPRMPFPLFLRLSRSCFLKVHPFMVHPTTITTLSNLEHLDQGLANSFGKGPDGNYFKQVIESLLQLLTSAIIGKKHLYIRYKWKDMVVFW